MNPKFRADLERSHRAEDLPLWEECYRKFFAPYFASMTNHRQDGEHQRAGIDRSVTLTNARQILVDEKARWKSYPDIALEYEHVHENGRKEAGWVCKQLRAEFIAYAVLPLGKCYLLPVIPLQQAWIRLGDVWKKKYPLKPSPNPGYDSWNCCVPVTVVFQEVGAGLRATFTPIIVESQNGKPVEKNGSPPLVKSTQPTIPGVDEDDAEIARLVAARKKLGVIH